MSGRGAVLAVLIGGLLASSSVKAGDHSRVIDFEDDVVEGVNKRPLDSVQQLGDADRRKKRSHLYRKRAGYKDETEQALLYLRYR